MNVKEERLGITIRPALSSDTPSIAEVLYKSFVEFRGSYTVGGFAATILRDDLIRSRMKEARVWVALDNDAIVGTVSTVPQGQGLYIRSMAVLPQARGKGTGGLLLSHVGNFASEHGFRRLFLSTTPFLTSAIRLYERWGF